MKDVDISNKFEREFQKFKEEVLPKLLVDLEDWITPLEGTPADVSILQRNAEKMTALVNKFWDDVARILP